MVDRFVAGGVRSGAVYPWQRAAIDEGSDGSNLVYCAPTSGGKSLVANVLLVRALARRARARPARARGAPVPVAGQREGGRPEAPARADVPQAHGANRRGQGGPRFRGECEGRRRAAAGARPGSRGGDDDREACVALSRLAAEGRLGELCAVVVDELHMVGDEDRGATLEAALAKLRFHERKRRRDARALAAPNADADFSNLEACQIIAMSATVAHDSLERLAGWLDARLFVTNYRPVPLDEHVVADGAAFAKRAAGFERVRGVPKTETLFAEAPAADRVALALVAESANEGHSCLAFCPSRNKTEALALALWRAFEKEASSNAGAFRARFAATRKVADARARLTRKLFAAAEGAPPDGLARAAEHRVAPRAHAREGEGGHRGGVPGRRAARPVLHDHAGGGREPACAPRGDPGGRAPDPAGVVPADGRQSRGAPATPRAASPS